MPPCVSTCPWLLVLFHEGRASSRHGGNGSWNVIIHLLPFPWILLSESREMVAVCGGAGKFLLKIN